MTRLDASDLANRLGREAEAVCRHYLGAGHRQGNYWQVGDARNAPGRSMFVRLKATAKGPAGKRRHPLFHYRKGEGDQGCWRQNCVL